MMNWWRMWTVSSIPRLRNAILICALAFGTTACSSDSSTNWPQIINIVEQSWAKSPSITLQQASAVPYATMGLRIGDGPETMIVLAADTGNKKLWTSSERIALTVRNGRIVESAGLPANVNATIFQDADPLDYYIMGGTEPRSATRQVDLWDRDLFGVLLMCELNPRGSVTIAILGEDIGTRRVDETCHSQSLDWTFTNSFWIGTNGLIWKSVQSIHPGLAPLATEILRPPT